MSLTSGSTFGVYTVGQLLGSGGMGEVYQARDTRLNRHVALKVLPEDVAHDRDRLARFTREAQALAALNHPHIAQIYGFEEVGERGALVLELVEGPTLADRLLRGALPLEEALSIASQIAHALEAAHEAAIVHRDLKPANVKITPSGVVKVLDFGLAKMYVSEGASRDAALSPTITAAGTRAGIVVGTAAYMSPEQARGATVDKRADIWAFGCVLFELLTGRTTFGADTVPDTVVRVLSGEPDLQLLPRGTPPAVVALIKRCLQKDPSRRLRDIADARLQIEDLASGSSMVAPVTHAWPRAALAGWIVAGLTAIAALVAVVWFRQAAEAPIIRLSFLTPPETNPFRFALSPDGRRVAYEGPVNGTPGLWVRSLDEEEGRPLAGTAGADAPFWSPDSRAIGFGADGVLKRIDLDAGFVRTLTPAPNMRKAAWGGANTILFGASSGPLYSVSAEGGMAQQATTLLPGQSSHRMPQFLPDGSRFLFLSTGADDARGIFVGELGRKEISRLIGGEPPFALLSPSHLLLARDGALWAQRLNAAGNSLEGAMIPVAPHVFTHSTNNGNAALSASAVGAIAYRPTAGQTHLVWVDRSGRDVAELTPHDDTQWDNAFLSRDGTTVTARRTINGNSDVWMLDSTRGQPRRLTFGATVDGEAVLSPDGRRVVYASDPKAGLWDVYERAADGAGADTVLLEGPDNESPRDWSPDGKYLLVARQSRITDYDLWALPTDRAAKPFEVAATQFAENNGRFSPDGAMVAFDSSETGRLEVFVEPFPSHGTKVQVSSGGGWMPRWRRDGRELYYMTADGRLMVVSIERHGATVTAAPPQELFRIPVGAWYEPAIDGQRFLIRRTVSPDSPITIVLNWTPPR